MQRYDSNYLPAFLKYGKHQKRGTIFGLCLLDMLVECQNYRNHVPHYLNTKLIFMSKEYLIHNILISKEISEVKQYNFNLQTMTDLYDHVLITDNKEDINGIIRIDCIENPFKLVNISPLTKVR